jgi:NTP pyrophosphatase (non-canonical NTP hydrolase)
MEMGWASGAGRFVAVYIPGMREPDLMVKMADYVGDDLRTIRQLLFFHANRPFGGRVPDWQRRVAEWYRANGGCANALDATDRMRMEVAELFNAVADRNVSAREEAADVAICLMIVAESLGVDLNQEIAKKHAINQQRRWVVEHDGTLHHIPGTDPRECLPKVRA